MVSGEINRRDFLALSGGGIGALALASILREDAQAATHPLAPQRPHFAPRAKRVLWLFMHGGPSHMDLWDPKPDLIRYAGQPLPASFGKVMTRRKVAKNPLPGPVKTFRPRGQSGIEISDFLPGIARHAERGRRHQVQVRRFGQDVGGQGDGGRKRRNADRLIGVHKDCQTGLERSSGIGAREREHAFPVPAAQGVVETFAISQKVCGLGALRTRRV